MNRCWGGTYRTFLWAAICAVGHAQTAPAVPATPAASGNAAAPAAAAAPAPAADSVTVLHVAQVPDSAAVLATSMQFGNRPLHVLVGRSIFIRTLTRLKRVYVSNPEAIDSLTSSPRQIVVTAKAPGVSSLILWDEAGESTTYLVFSDLDVTNLQSEIHEALPYDNITVQADEGRVSLSGLVLSDASADAAVKLATLYAKSVINSLVVRPPHTPQVCLKVQIIEIDRSKLTQFGINLFNEASKTVGGSTTGQYPSTPTYTPATPTTPATIAVTNPLNLLLYNFGLNIGLTLQDLQNRNLAQILAEPTITTLSGQKASFLAGGEFPFPIVSASGGLASVSIQFRPYGVKLEFTPVVNRDNTIELKVTPEVSALDFTNAVAISGYTVPAISTRRAETQVELRSGQSFAISGLLDHRTTDAFQKMPGIGDVPILGQLFRSKSVNHSTVELMVVVTPTIVDPLTDMAPPSPPKLPMPVLDNQQFDKNTVKEKPGKQAASGTGGAQ